MRKIIFLDIDGVIAIPLGKEKRWGLCAEKQMLLKKILDATNAEIVLSSSWRLHNLHETRKHMTEEGFWFANRITGITVRGYHYTKSDAIDIPRGSEIKHWIDENIQYNSDERCGGKILGEDYAYVILDDDTDMLYEQRDLFVRTHGTKGLNEQDVEKAISILNDW